MGIDFLAKARRLESRIARRFDRAAEELVGSGDREPLEVVHAIVAAAAHQVQSGGRGRRVFPFNRIAVTIVASAPAARAHLEALCGGDFPLRDRILERLRLGGCDVVELAVDVKYVARAQKGWTSPDLHVGFARSDAGHPAGVIEPRTVLLELVVVRGVANHRKHSFAGDRIDLGRCEEVRDNRNRLVRRNDLAFTEGSGEINNSVSRQHAHIAYVRASGHYRLHDDGSAHGTSVVRSGKTVPVPAGARGVRLQSGDEILLGDVRLRVRLHTDS